MMLRITQIQGTSDEVHLILEGRLVAPWVAELQEAVVAARATACIVHLDLSGIRFMDDQGRALFIALREQGMQLHNASPFVEELLKTRQQ